MFVKAWNNGSHKPDGNGYGIKIEASDRDKYFHREWKNILLQIEGEAAPIEINIDKDSFWNQTCRELISVKFGRWLLKNRYAPWENMNPPVFILDQVDGRCFLLNTDPMKTK